VKAAAAHTDAEAPFSEGRADFDCKLQRVAFHYLTDATVIYNLKDQFMGLRFEEMPSDQAAIVADWLKAAVPSTHNPAPVGTLTH